MFFWADAYGVYIEAQAGFRANYSTVDHIFNLHGVMSHLLNNSGGMGVTSAWSPLGNFLEGQAHPNVFCLSSNQVFLFF